MSQSFFYQVFIMIVSFLVCRRLKTIHPYRSIEEIQSLFECRLFRIIQKPLEINLLYLHKQDQIEYDIGMGW